jgi:hypothetical protein
VNDANSPNTGHGNTLGSTSANDVGIAVVGNSSPLCTDTNPGYEVNNNTVSAANEAGIALTNLGNAFGGHLASPLSSNAVSGVTTGVGIEAEGITNQTIGGVLSTEGNSVTGSALGLVIAPCSSTACEAEGTPGLGLKSSGNLVQNNSFTGNIAYGELTVGSYQVDELAEQIPVLVAPLLSGSGNTFNANNWGTPTSATNGTLPSEIDGSEVEDGTGWDGGCVSETGDCPVSSLTYEGPNTTFGTTFPGSATFTLSVCDASAGSENLPAGTEITFNTPNQEPELGETNDGGTFFVTQSAIITGNTSGCGVGSNSNQWQNVSLQAIAPARVGTLAAPAGQPYILATGDSIYVNANGSLIQPSLNSYGHGANSNSCTPAGAVGTTVPTEVPSNIFGETDPPYTQLSTTLQASTGGVNATYVAC